MLPNPFKRKTTPPSNSPSPDVLAQIVRTEREYHLGDMSLTVYEADDADTHYRIVNHNNGYQSFPLKTDKDIDDLTKLLLQVRGRAKKAAAKAAAATPAADVVTPDAAPATPATADQAQGQ